MFKQCKKYIVNFIIEALAIKTEINNLYTIFLLKKSIWIDIIKTILEYPPMAVPKTLREWKVAITLVRQGYESTKSQQDYRIGTEIIYKGRSVPMGIRKAKDNFNKDKKPKCFNCNIYKYILKDCQKPRKEKDARKCYKYNKIGYIAKNCRSGQMIKNHSIQDELDNEENNKQKDFGEGFKQTQYKELIYLMLKINMLFQTNKTTKRES